METASNTLVPTLLDVYPLVPPVTTFALEHAGLNNVNTGLQTGDGTYVVRVHESLCYDDAASFAYEHALLTWLAGQGLSFGVPVPLPTRAGEPGFAGPWGDGEAEGPHGRHPGGWTSLTPKLPGTPLARQAYDPALLGAALGELQAALLWYPAEPRPGRPLFGELFRFGSPPLDAPSLRPEQLGLPADARNDDLFGWWRDEAASLDAFVAGAYRELPWQLCHCDVTPNNVLAEDGRVTGLLDFEFAAPAPSAMDFVTSLRMVMRFWDPDPAWEEIRRFCQGYARWLRLHEAELSAVPALLRLRSAITVLWWIGRAAATGQPGSIPERIASAQKMARWLEPHQPRLLDLLRHQVT